MRQEEEQSLSKLEESSSGHENGGFGQQFAPPGYSRPQRVRHVYLEEENIYGRFVPYLLLKDQLESEIDSSGNTALHHMCSHNSPYLPLYLSTLTQGDPILNRKSKMGHTPLDVAGLYCPLEVVEMMKQKGAIDDGNVDHWAIQGANLANWSGKVDTNKKFLIHWAAYNDLPEVLEAYHKIGMDLGLPDTNGHTAMDLTVLNKSYNSFKVLADLGHRPKPELMASCDSKSMKKYLHKLNEPPYKQKARRIIKELALPVLLILCLFLHIGTLTITFCSIAGFLWLYLICIKPKPQPYLNDNRTTAFTSELLEGATINKNNYLAYMFLHVFTILSIISSMASAEILNHVKAFIFLILLIAAFAFSVHLLILTYGVAKNLTYSEMFYAHKWAHLWGEIKYIQERQLLVRQYSNPYDQGLATNVCTFLRG